MFVKRGKRGISPLIATVLLVAFAVAVGVMIMNVRNPPKGTGADCSGVNLELQIINGKPLLCYDTLNNKINVMVRNTGNVDVEKLKLIVTAADFTRDEFEIEGSAIKVGNIITKQVDYVKSGTFKVEFAPMVRFGGTISPCLNKSVVAETLERCN